MDKLKVTDYESKPKVKKSLEDLIGLYIDGKYIPAVNGETFDVINPATEETSAQVSEAQADDIDVTVQAVKRAFDEGT